MPGVLRHAPRREQTTFHRRFGRRLNGTPPSSRTMPMKKQFTKEPYSRLIKSHTGSTISKEERLQSNPIPSIFQTKKPSSLKIRRNPKMKRLSTTTKRGSDEIKAKKREAIGPRITESVDQHNRRETPERSRRRIREKTRRGDKSRIAPSKRAQATGGKNRLYSSKRPQYTGDSHRKEIGDRNQSFISLSSS
ncbi:hypothetical protein F2Q70_00042223 [Brassica cretica]|uniref:Uncharacterized protein n=2 Tax=Brassica cretica TaxID=69181 RepID=A0A8S9JZ72_BRACR|nr:hypothetical protein F2Q70_00042223 [Brassica cretica]KAF2619979.1 hypothetical protein F2Q68_00042891 [Brassica cretica]KAF3495227.1 hypothetical protein DY000_02058402 [Brassica cretica]